jgi:multicomponent Na+:H+ antiporter subunit D
MLFLASYTTHTAVYALARCFTGHEILIILGTVSALWGMGYALFQRSVSRILAYLIVSQIGFMVTGVGIGTPLSINGAVAHAYAHMFYNGLLFMAAGALITASGKDALDELKGLGRRYPLIMAGFLFGALAISGIPPLSGFVSIPMIIEGAMDAGKWLVALCLGLALLGTVVTAGVRIPMLLLRASPDQGEKAQHAAVPINMPIALGKAAMVSLILGVFPQVLYHHLPRAVAYRAYTLWHVAGVLLLFGLAIPVFLVIRNLPKRNQWQGKDMDVLYRLVGDIVHHGVARPLAWLDDRWSTVYRTIGIRGLMRMARGTAWVDKKGIDAAVDGAAHNLRRLGIRTALFQHTGFQDQVAWMILLALGIFALFWFIL